MVKPTFKLKNVKKWRGFISIDSFLTELSSSVLNICPSHFNAFDFAANSIDTVKSSIVMNSLVFFLSINFTLHLALNTASFSSSQDSNFFVIQTPCFA